MTPWYLVKDHFQHLTDKSYHSEEWMLMRIFFMASWSMPPFYILSRFDSAPYPEGICRLFDCATVTIVPLNYILMGVIALLMLAYIFHKKMLWTTLALFLFSLVLFTLEKSNAMTHRRELYTMMFFGQFLAYLFNYLHLKRGFNLPIFKKPVHENAIQFSIQFLAAAYILAAITKLQINGVGWVWNSPNLALQMLKQSYWEAYANNDLHAITKGEWLANLIVEHKNIARLFFGGALLLELFAWLMVLSKRIAFYYGLVMFIFHMAILFTLDIYLDAFANSVLIFCINLPWILAAPFMVAKEMKHNKAV